MNRHFSPAIALLLAITGLLAYADNNPYMAKVYDFQPAPGQFINQMPKYVEGNTKEKMIAKVEERLVKYYDDEEDSMVYNPRQLVSLGGYGGYIVFGFDHPVINVPGAYDLKIDGNAFQAEQSSTQGGSSEPGIVMVSQDLNHNGIPDDPWYELAGSEYNNPRTQHDYVITYYQPDEDKEPTPSKENPTMFPDTTYIRWTSNDSMNPDSVKGYMWRNQYHRQSYWPGWLTDSATLTFRGAKLPCNAFDQSGNGTYWVQRFYDWGYVDNRPNLTDPGLKIDWAVDSEGRTVKLDYIDFVKVYSAVNQACGWLGETSTEIIGAEDLHPQASGVQSVSRDMHNLTLLRSAAGALAVRNAAQATMARVYALSGAQVATLSLPEGDSSHNLSGLAPGAYVLRTATEAIKFVR